MSTPTAKPRSQFCPVPQALYQTPSGRVCCLVRFTSDEDGKRQAEMAYAVKADGGLNRTEGFTLAQRAWHLLRRVA